MLREGRYYDPQETLRLALEALQARIWTHLPCVVAAIKLQAPNAQMTVDLQPTINGTFTDNLGVDYPVQMPVLPDCPVIFPSGGGATLTFPVKVGDECVALISARAIDNWWASSWQPGQAWPGAGNPAMNPPSSRTHSLSDAFALFGVKSVPNAFAVDASNVSLQSNDGECYIKLNPTTHAIAITAPGGINLNGATIDANGHITDGDGTTILHTHTHTNGNDGADTGPPVA
jgi:hypothetical protein